MGRGLPFVDTICTVWTSRMARSASLAGGRLPQTLEDIAETRGRADDQPERVEGRTGSPIPEPLRYDVAM